MIKVKLINLIFLLINLKIYMLPNLIRAFWSNKIILAQAKSQLIISYFNKKIKILNLL